MKKINVLDKHTAQLIAAGEVVERPASVLKELLENSIDSGATRITVEIKNGGVKYLKVADNGSGIFSGDVKNAFLRHATSKLKSSKDLESINSLGFRGEALASICAVSKVELITKTEEELSGSRYFINAGVPGRLEEWGCSNGTTIIVRDLFYNTPARMKFLKKDVSEANACAGVIDKLALSHPEIAFKFIREGKEVLNTLGDGKISSAIYCVYGKEFFDGMMPVNYQLNNIKLSGFISRPRSAKSSRSFQNFFVNGRFVKIKVGSSALEEAFKNSVMVGKFPYCVIYIDISPEFVDVNVHPAKTEVKFVNEKSIFEVIYYGVKSALMAENNMISRESESMPTSLSFSDFSKSVSPCLTLSKNKISTDFEVKKEETGVFKNWQSLFERPSVTNPVKNNYFAEPKPNNPTDSEPSLQNLPVGMPNQKNLQENHSCEKTFSQIDIHEPVQENFIQKSQPKNFKIVGEIFNCYILIEYDKELILVDKHAAHERIIFEKLKENAGENESQNLLSPLVITLEKNEYSAITQNTDLLSKVGYIVEDFGCGSVIVRGVPMYILLSEVENSILEIANYIINHKENISTAKLEWLYHNIACRSAIKGGKGSSEAEIIALINKLIEKPSVKYCPHGRPIFVSITKKFIEKEFGRV